MHERTEPAAGLPGRARLWHAPAVQAALIQVLAAAPTAALLYLLTRLPHPPWSGPVPVYAAALLQGAFAALVTYFRRLAPWWCLIQLVFPVALLGADALRLPPAVLLGSPAVMSALWQKAKREMRPATMLISYEFAIRAAAPDETIAATPSGPPLYVWYF
jgi:hypothetical protein